MTAVHAVTRQEHYPELDISGEGVAADRRGVTEGWTELCPSQPVIDWRRTVYRPGTYSQNAAHSHSIWDGGPTLLAPS